MAFDKIFRGSPLQVVTPASPESPNFGVDVVNDIVYVNTGNGWVAVGGGSGGGLVSALPDDLLAAPSGASSYSLGFTPLFPEASLYFVNGIKRIYGTYYEIVGSNLILLGSLPQIGDTHEIYVS